MFSVELKCKAGDREVSLERFVTLFLKELLRSAQDEIRPQPAPTIVAAPVSLGRKEPEPRAVGLKQAALLLGVREPSVRKHVRLGTIPSVRVGRRVLLPMKAINDLTMQGF